MEKFTPLAKILHCRRHWRHWQISPLCFQLTYIQRRIKWIKKFVGDFYEHEHCSDSEVMPQCGHTTRVCSVWNISYWFHKSIIVNFTNPLLSTARLLGILAFLVASANAFLMTWIRLTADEDFISQCCPNEPFFELQLIKSLICIICPPDRLKSFFLFSWSFEPIRKIWRTRKTLFLVHTIVAKWLVHSSVHRADGRQPDSFRIIQKMLLEKPLLSVNLVPKTLNTSDLGTFWCPLIALPLPC